MEVKILNPEELEVLYKNHGVFACTCYNTPEKFAPRVGESCQGSGHMSGSRCEYVKFRLIDIDRGTAEQIMRHEIGTSVPYDEMDNYSFADFSELVVDVSPDQIIKNMGSFRYIDESGFDYLVPNEIKRNQKLSEIYNKSMKDVDNVRAIIKETLVTDDNVDPKRANEVANFVLPRATVNVLTIGFTPEALIHFMHKRLCTRAQPEIREVAIAMKKAVAEVNSKFAEELVPHCQHLLWCPEKEKSCGAYHTKAELKAKLKEIGWL